jgi:hypothetical protein
MVEVGEILFDYLLMIDEEQFVMLENDLDDYMVNQ